MAVRRPTPMRDSALSLGAVPKAKSTRRPLENASNDMEWTFPENVTMPEGGDTRFTSTSFSGKTYFDVTMLYPSQYSVFKASRSKAQ